MGVCEKPSNEINWGGVVRVPLETYNEASKGVSKLIIKERKKTATAFF